MYMKEGIWQSNPEPLGWQLLYDEGEAANGLGITKIWRQPWLVANEGNGWMGGWMNAWMDAWIALNKQKEREQKKNEPEKMEMKMIELRDTIQGWR